MIDLSTIDPEVLHARGCYSTVRSAHEDSKHVLQKECGDGMSLFGKILKHGTSDDPMEINESLTHLNGVLLMVDRLQSQLREMRSLAEQRAELKTKAWAK
jgi:hypothetical protein